MRLALAILLLAGGIGLLFWDTGVLQDPGGAWTKTCNWFRQRPKEPAEQAGAAPMAPVMQMQVIEQGLSPKPQP